MVNKKISGQAITIIILAVLLLITIAFGGVYAFYSARSNKMTGTIVMANLNIDLRSYEYGTKSARSEIVISHGTNFVPGQELKNSALMVVNKSAELTPIYVIVVYEIKATKLNEKGEIIPGEIIEDQMKDPLIDIGAQYINMDENIILDKTTNSDWVDYVFTYTKDEVTKKYRCLVTTSSYSKPKGVTEHEIKVIGEDKLKLHYRMSNEYQRTSLAFAFQAYAIGANSFQFTEETTQAQKCNQIVSAIYESVEYEFFEGIVNEQGGTESEG